MGLGGSCRGVCVPIWSNLIIAGFCVLVCRGGGAGGGGGISLTQALRSGIITQNVSEGTYLI